jgi:hypothetical protein
MLGQLNLFSFKPKVKIFYPTPIYLNQELWTIVRKTDPRGYSFGSFDRFKNNKVNNTECATVVLYNDKPIGFCTISLPGTYRVDAYLDVWVMPYYRDLGFGSILVNRANKRCLKLFGSLPGGADKNHSHCWDARFRKNNEYSYNDYYPNGQHQLRLPFEDFNFRARRL